MELKIEDVVVLHKALSDMFESSARISSVSASYRLAQAKRKLEQEAKTYEEQRVALIRELGEPIEDGTMVQVKKENKEEYAKRINELLAVSVQIDLTQVSIAELGDAFPSKYVDLLWKLIKEQ